MAAAALDLGRHNSMTAAGRDAFHDKARKGRGKDLDGRIILGLCATVLLLAGGAGVWALFTGGLRAPEADTNTAVARGAEAPATDALTNMRSRGQETLRRFFAAATPEEKSQWVIDGERLLPAMKEYYGQDGVDSPGGAAAFAFGSVSEKDDPATGAMAMSSDSGALNGSPLVIYLKDDGTRARLDWEAYTQDLNGLLTAFLREPRTGAAVFSVGLSRTHLFEDGLNKDAPGAELWLSGGRSTGIKAVAQAGTPAAAALTDLMWNSRQRAVARLEWLQTQGGKPVVCLRDIIQWGRAD